MPDIDDVNPFGDRPIDGIVDVIDDGFVVLRDVILNVNDDQRVILHAPSSFVFKKTNVSSHYILSYQSLRLENINKANNQHTKKGGPRRVLPFIMSR